MKPEQVAELISQRGGTTRNLGRGQWSASCPSPNHGKGAGDRSPSLTLSPGTRGAETVMRCHAGCDLADILDALSLRKADLFPPKEQRPAQPRAQRTVYRYEDTEGRLLYCKERVESGRNGRSKDIRYFRERPDGTRDYRNVFTAPDSPPHVLYRLRRVLEVAQAGGDLVWAEGEKCVHALERLGQIATTAGGVGDWRPEFADCFKGAGTVRIIADLDEPGIRHAREVADALTGIAGRVILLRANVETVGADIVDHLDAGFTLADLVPLDPEPAAARPAPESAGDALTPPTMDGLLALCAEYLYLGAGDHHIRFALAVGVSAALDGDPLWGQIVGAPSGGKTEAIDLMAGVVDEKVDDLTGPALLSWSKGKSPRPVGILTRVGARAFLTVGDFSTVLADSDRGARDKLFSLLRRAYDGEVTRDVGNMPGQLQWSGRLTLLAGCTPAIDNYSSHTDALGPRWLYCRLADMDELAKREAARKRRETRNLAQKQANAVDYARRLVEHARHRVADFKLSESTYEAIEDAAIVTCYGRADIPRSAYGRKEVEGVATIEEPPRLVHQLTALARSLVALGESEQSAVAICRQCALDTIPRPRLRVLEELALGEELTVSELHRRTGLHRVVVKRSLEDLQVVGLTACPLDEGEEYEERPGSTSPKPWRLDGSYGVLAVSVIALNRADHRTPEVTGG